ncbi:MAG TPA: hypothetical protein VLH09_10070, partial [Bryobacteraceae bacterium]|nr:hypothetical protein [Bryobacteraceae bacterium]
MPFNVESALRDGATEDQVLDYLRPLSKGYNVDLALKAGATKRQVIDYLAANSGVSAELASKSGSLDTPDEKGWWDSKSDMDKQIALDTAGEIVGGTAGAILGGAAGTPTGPLGTTAGASLGAGTGAALGKGAARLAGGAMGLKIPPQSIADKAAEYGVSFAAGALGEGLGRVAMAAGGATKAATKNAVRRGLRSADAAEIERLAREQGVPVRGAMLSRPVSIAEQA